MIGIFGTEEALYPSAGFYSGNAVLQNPLAPKYLAEGDGKYEDGRLFQRAVDELTDGGRKPATLYVFGGRSTSYLVRGTLGLYSNVQVLGVGRPVFRKADGAAGQLVANADQANGNAGIVLSGVDLDGNRATITPVESGNTSSTALFVGCSALRLLGVHVVESPYVAFDLENCSDMVIADCAFDHPYKFGIFVGTNTGRSDDVVIERTRVTRPGRGGIVVDSGYGAQGSVTNVTVRDCLVADANDDWGTLTGITGGGYGFDVEEGVDGVRLLGNTARDCSGAGFSIAGGQHSWPVRNAHVEGNEAVRSGSAGFDIIHLRDSLVRGNTARDGSYRGFQVRYSLACGFRDNLAQGNNNAGFQVFDSPRCTFEGNTARNNSAGAANAFSGFVVVGDNYSTLTNAPGTAYPVPYSSYVPDSMAFVGNRAFDDRTTSTAAMDAGSTTLKTLNAMFNAQLVGRAITVPGAGAAGADLVTTIAAFLTPWSVSLAAAASTTVTDKTISLRSQKYGLEFQSTFLAPATAAAPVTNAVVADNDLRGNVSNALLTTGLDLATATINDNLPAGGFGVAVTVFDEDFVSVPIVAAAGTGGWEKAVTGSGDVVVVGVQGHPGVRRLTTGATNPSVAGLRGANAGNLHSDDYWDVTYWIDARQIDADAIYRFGLAASTVDPPSSGVYFERLGGEANWRGVTRTGGVQTRVDTGAMADGNFHRFRFRRFLVGGVVTVGFSIDDGAEVVSTTNIGTGLAWFLIGFVSNGAAAADKQLDLDRIRVDMISLAR